MLTFRQYAQQEQHVYQQFLEMLDSIQVDESGMIVESINLKLPKAVQFIQEFSLKTKIAVMEVIELFRDKIVYEILSSLNWSITKFFNMVKSGYQYWEELHDALARFINETKLVKFSKKNVEEFERWLDQNAPNVKKASSYVLAGFLVYQWR